MSANLFRVNPSQAASPGLASTLLGVIEGLNQQFAQLQLLHAAMVQEFDDSSNTDTQFVTISRVFGFVDSNGAVSSAVAHSGFAEVDSMLNAAGPSLQQLCARFKQ